MRSIYPTMTIVALLAGLFPAVAVAQDGNVIPYVEDVEWLVYRSVDGSPTGFYINQPESFEPGCDPNTDTSCLLLREADVVVAIFTVIDLDWEPSGEDDDGEDDDVYFRFQADWLPFGAYRAPEPPTIPEMLEDFRLGGGWNSISPISGRRAYRSVFAFTIPTFNGVNQARLRGLINYDVRWRLWIEVTNESSGDDATTYADCQRYAFAGGSCLPEFRAIEHPAPVPANAKPFADAGPDQLLPAGSTVQLDGQRTFDSYNLGFNQSLPGVFAKDSITFTWEWVSGPARVEPTYPDLDRTPELATVVLDTPGVYVYRLLTDDNVNPTPTTDTVTITIAADLPTNVAPRAVITGPTTTVFVGETVTLDGGASYDPEGETLSYRWNQTDEIGNSLTPADRDRLFQPISGTNTSQISWQTTQAGTYFFRLIVDDGTLEDDASFTLFIDDAPAGVVVNGESLRAGVLDALTAAEIQPVDAAAPSEPTATNTNSSAPFGCGGGLFPLLAVPMGMWLMRGRRRLQRVD